jgi:hypothetical protein
MMEFLTSGSRLQEIEEAMDLYHSLETYFRICEREGIDVDGQRSYVQSKNEARGYYNGSGGRQ